LKAVHLSIIAAVGENGVIGTGGGMPWRLSTDMQRFKRLTMGKPVIMGRKTFESLGKPLAGRRNIVVTGNRDFTPEGVTVAPDFEAALTAAREFARLDGVDEAMVIGGGQVYRESIPKVDRLYITHVEAIPEGDTHFPDIDPARWKVASSEAVSAGPRDSAATTFVIYERVGAGRSG
jgi:dihydrofolate reductase